jgi:RNA polymerase sigma-70 factor (ECF subfamily)
MNTLSFTYPDVEEKLLQLSDREEKFLGLLRPVYSSAERYTISLAENREEARDILQDALVILWQKFDDLRDISAFKSYLFTVITNLGRHYHKRYNRFSRLEEGVADEIESTSPLPDRTTEAAIVKDALLKIPQRSREALVLYELHDFSIEEISKIQNSSISAVKVRLMRARRLLASHLHISPVTQLIPESR